MKRNNDSLLAGSATPLGARATRLLFLAAFLGTAVEAWLVQLVLLPYFLPQLHAGDGMLAGGLCGV